MGGRGSRGARRSRRASQRTIVRTSRPLSSQNSSERIQSASPPRTARPALGPTARLRIEGRPRALCVAELDERVARGAFGQRDTIGPAAAAQRIGCQPESAFGEALAGEGPAMRASVSTISAGRAQLCGTALAPCEQELDALVAPTRRESCYGRACESRRRPPEARLRRPPDAKRPHGSSSSASARSPRSTRISAMLYVISAAVDHVAQTLASRQAAPVQVERVVPPALEVG